MRFLVSSFSFICIVVIVANHSTVESKIMVQLTTQERVFIVKTYIETKSYAKVRERFQIEFPGRPPPVGSTIFRNFIKYNQHGTSLNRNAVRSGRPKSGRSNENIDRVQETLKDNPDNIACRRNGLGLSKSTFNRICKIDLKWHPYKMRERHELKPTDPGRRIQFCQWLLNKCRDRRFLHNFLIGDEAGFAMNGRVNSQNVRQYAPRGGGPAPDFNYTRNESRKRVTVWVGLCGDGSLFGPFFFEGSVNGLNYLTMLNEEVFPQLIRKFGNQFNNGPFARLWWAQDGAPAHNALQTREWLEEFFPNHIVALNHAVEWPPHSPDLSPCEFFLWGYVKSKVYVSPPTSIDDLKAKINREIRDVKRDPMLIQRAMRDMIRRSRMCIQQGGTHIERLLENK